MTIYKEIGKGAAYTILTCSLSYIIPDIVTLEWYSNDIQIHDGISYSITNSFDITSAYSTLKITNPPTFNTQYTCKRGFNTGSTQLATPTAQTN